MIDWKLLAVSVPILFVSYQTLAKSLPKGTPIFLVNAYIAVVGLVIMLALHFLTEHNKSSLSLTGKTAWLALGMGVLIALGNFGIIKAYSLGAPQSTFTILFYISLIIYGIIFGLFVWHERLQFIQVIGILLAIGGIFLAIYPKTK